VEGTNSFHVSAKGAYELAALIKNCPLHPGKLLFIASQPLLIHFYLARRGFERALGGTNPGSADSLSSSARGALNLSTSMTSRPPSRKTLDGWIQFCRSSARRLVYMPLKNSARGESNWSRDFSCVRAFCPYHQELKLGLLNQKFGPAILAET
jgi:hypothetical protein